MVLTLSFLQLTTVQAIRAISMLILASLGFGVLMSARGHAAKVSRRWQLYIGLLTTGLIVFLAFQIRADAGATRFRTGMFAAFMTGALVMLTNTILEHRHPRGPVEGRGTSRQGDLL
jgi:hypothetical protein